jgi:hypothetical protein
MVKVISSFCTLAVSDLEMLVSCVRHLSDFCSVCSDLAPVSSSLSSVSTPHFLY